MENVNKYGRPKLPDNEKREIRIDINVSTDEFKKLKKKFGETDFRGKLREFLLNEEPFYALHSDDSRSVTDHNLTIELKKIGVNLNQITYKINIGEYPVPGEIEALLQELLQFISNRLK